MLKVESEKKPKLAQLLQKRTEHAAAIAAIDAKLELSGAKLPKGTNGSDPSSTAVARLRQKLSISQEEFGRITGYSVRAIAGVEAGKAPSKSAARKIKEVTRLLTAVSELMPARQVGAWLRQPNQAFQGQSPIHIMERGETDQIWEMIYQIDANVAN